MFESFLRRSEAGEQTIPTIDVREAWERLSSEESQAILIDVREPWEYRSGHAPRALNIPLGQLSSRAREVPRDREVLLICLSGHRSAQAARQLQHLGFSRVVNVKGGMAHWRLHRLPVE
ncbi:rhodanese-like domain-containing protein [Thermogemmatispora sp.]|uniref:rhodanese-like domain-containing protein n=1 Tax=Thermogemmatispora sp. TaxID=1968838 RepID=UPI001D922C36|nr:rhodanese-like domain-containing protein [Thermogemmatispora sp.]MBX5448954.1 rhodanese-like domain-containing protein [Thermogemmatispora sp.]